jgi:hypothetical protein
MALTWGTSWGTSWATSWGQAVVPEPPIVLRGGGADYRRKRKKEEPLPDVFKEMEKTIYELIHPQEPVEAVAEAVTAPPVETLEEKLSDLLALAGESHALLQRAAQVRADVDAFAKARREAADLDDEEAVLWLG